MCLDHCAYTGDAADCRRWDVLTANSVPQYYDLWALRSENLLLTYDCLRDEHQVRARGICFNYRVQIDINAPAIPVDRYDRARHQLSQCASSVLPSSSSLCA